MALQIEPELLNVWQWQWHAWTANGFNTVVKLMCNSILLVQADGDCWLKATAVVANRWKRLGWGVFQGPPPLPIQLSRRRRRRRRDFTVGTFAATLQPVDTVGRGAQWAKLGGHPV